MFGFIESQQAKKIDMALEIFNGLFSHILSHLIKFKSELCQIFKRTLEHESLDIKLAALKATINYLSVADRSDTKDFTGLIPLLAGVVTTAFEEDDETVLEEALVEMIDLAEIEAGFFRAKFNNLYTAFKPIMEKSDFDKPTLRHMPMEFVVTMIEQKPTLAKKSNVLLKDVVEQTFKIMIDVDEEIDEAWLKPDDAFLGEDEEEPNVSFGKMVIDRLFAAVEDEKMLPVFDEYVNYVLDKENWRYKQAGMMALAPIGEHIYGPSTIELMVPKVIKNCADVNPKIRYDALYCLTQLAEDMHAEFPPAFAGPTIPAATICLDDEVPRVQA